MTEARESVLEPVGLGLRALRGGAVVVGVALDGDDARVVSSTFLATAAEGDRLAFEPYHVAAEMERGADGGASTAAAAAVAEGRKRQDALAAKGLDDIVRKLQTSGCEAAVAALLVNRSGWIPDLLAYSLAFADHPPVAEGLAVREALRAALGGRGIAIDEMDEKSLPEQASQALRRSPADLDLCVKALGATAGKPWRKEQKLACLAAWVAIAARRRVRS
jgi:hypothetical protein